MRRASIVYYVRCSLFGNGRRRYKWERVQARVCQFCICLCVFIFTDVPPLEDLTEAVQRARALRTQPQRRGETRAGDNRAAKDGVKKRTQPKETPAKAAESFGGFSKGFLLSNPAGSTRPSTGVQSLAKTPPTPERDLSDDGDIPFLKAKTTAKGPVLPEVQEAMKEAYPLLNTEG